MNAQTEQLPMMNVPSGAEAAQAVQEARRLFARTLSGWASDVLRLRRLGLHRPAWSTPDSAARWSKAA